MDITVLRIATTVLGFVCFLAIVVWVLDRRKTRAFEQAAQLPFLGD
jgi:cytochrome c oxidase cbb3-type subunit 4